jgi:hypothetical protein
MLLKKQGVLVIRVRCQSKGLSTSGSQPCIGSCLRFADLNHVPEHYQPF